MRFLREAIYQVTLMQIEDSSTPSFLKYLVHLLGLLLLTKE